MVINLIENIIVIIVFVGNSLLGLAVFFYNKKVSRNQYFLGFSLCLSFWILTAYLSEIFPLSNPAFSLYLTKFAFAFSFLMLFFLFLFSSTFNKTSLIDSKIIKKIFYFIISVLIFILVFTKEIISNIRIYQEGKFDVIYGALFNFLFLPPCLLLLILIFYNFFSGYRSLSAKEKLQLQYFFAGLGIFFVISFFSTVVMRIITKTDLYYRVGNYSSILFLALVSYAIVKKKLFGIKVILVEILVVLMALILFIQIIVSDTTPERVLSVSTFLLFCISGYFLIRSTLREVHLREQLEKANKELLKIDEAKTEFLSIASHQLRTPLTAIKGYLGMIDEGIYGPVPEKVHEILHKVDESNERLIRLVNSLLDISRLELGRMEFDFQETDIEEMLENIVDEFHIAARKKGLSLVFEHPKEELPKILIDPFKIRQVFLNLVDNAIKYTYEGKVTVKAKLINNHGREKIQISVSDTGMGIAKKEKDEIFKIYRRGTGVRLFPEGSGVGLYVAKKLVESHKGKIWAKSQGKGKGSTFYVELPVRREISTQT